MNTLTVSLAERSYPIYIGQNLLAVGDMLNKHIPGKQIMIVSNPTIANLYLQDLMMGLRNYQCDYVLLPEGEENKNLFILNRIFDALIEKRHHRNTTLIALGGGVIGDMTGFAAACYQRGANFIQIPTSLLAQVDASIGGKTAVNHALGKNMIGAFYQPRCVIIDIATLVTLNERELRAGIAEIIKAALICDREFFAWLEQNIEQLLLRQPEALIYAIQRACEIKANIVAEDETERGARALLNLGHTFGHAIEQYFDYKHWLHGEAVAIGLALAAELSVRLKWLSENEAARIRNILIAAQLPIYLPTGLEYEKIVGTMAVDKKIVNTGMRLILLKSIGQAVIKDNIDTSLIKAVLQQASQ